MGNAEYMGCHVYLLRNGLPGADERNVQTWCRQPTWADVEHSTFPRHDAYQPQCGVPEGSGLGFSWPMANGTPKGDGLHCEHHLPRPDCLSHSDCVDAIRRRHGLRAELLCC